MSEILKTKDYSIFKTHPNNSEVEEAHVKKLMVSLSKKNLLEYKPILVMKRWRSLMDYIGFTPPKELE